MKEQVEIVMATYNGEKYIKEQLDSLLSQSHPYLLVDVCDDGSTDDTVSIVKEYEKKDSRVRLFENKTNQGYIRNFMSALFVVTARILCCVTRMISGIGIR